MSCILYVCDRVCARICIMRLWWYSLSFPCFLYLSFFSQCYLLANNIQHKRKDNSIDWQQMLHSGISFNVSPYTFFRPSLGINSSSLLISINLIPAWGNKIDRPLFDCWHAVICMSFQKQQIVSNSHPRQ